MIGIRAFGSLWCILWHGYVLVRRILNGSFQWTHSNLPRQRFQRNSSHCGWKVLDLYIQVPPPADLELNWPAGIARLCKLQSCVNCTPLRANPRTPWTGRLEYSSLRIPGVVQCYARCWIEEIGLRRMPKRSEEYLTRPPLSTHASTIMSSLMMMARTHNSGLQCWVWLMRGRVAGKPHKVFFPISAARDPRKVALITVVTTSSASWILFLLTISG